MLYEDPASGEESTYMHLTTLPTTTTASSSSAISSSSGSNPLSSDLSVNVVTHGAQLLLALYRTEGSPLSHLLQPILAHCIHPFSSLP